jgi:hypothetical protein
VILRDTEAFRELVRESLAATGSRQGSSLLDLNGLDTARRQTLLAWASYAMPEAMSFTMPGASTSGSPQPRIAPGVFGSIVRLPS